MSDDAADIHTLSGAYALDALAPDEAAAFERHLRSCVSCREELTSFSAAVAAMAEDAIEEAPADLRSSVLSAITEVRPLPPRVPDAGTNATVIPLEPRRSRRLATWFAVAAAVLGIAMAGAVWRSVSLQSQVSQLSAAASELTAVLTAPDAQTATAATDSGSRATVVMSMSKGQAVLVTQGMAPAPAGSTYQVWFVGADGAAPAGFIPDDPSTATLLTGDPHDAAAVGVTLEPEGGSPQPTTDPLMVVELPATA